MSSEKLAIIILAAGLGKRMGSDLPKVLTKTRQKELIAHVLDVVSQLRPEKVVVVTGHKRELVEDTVTAGMRRGDWKLSALEFALQKEQRGTGDAVKSALASLHAFKGSVLMLYGDCPVIEPATLSDLIRHHAREKDTVSFVSFDLKETNQYGRILRDEKGRVIGIKEARDCSPAELAVTEVNSGIYVVDSSFLEPAIAALKNDNAQKEYYLTDIVGHAVREGQRVSALRIKDHEQLLGVNTYFDLTQINGVLRMKKIRELIDSGVIVEDPATCFVDDEVKIESGAVLGPNVKVAGKTRIAAGAVVEGASLIKDCTIGEKSVIKWSCRIEGATIGQECSVGPFANIRPESRFADNVKVGNFVETKKALLHENVKASHLTYLGDCEIGQDSNIGAGTITCNYDGFKKYRTGIGKNVFIGSNTALVAPVEVGDGATIGAGSVITKDVEAESLSFTRPQQLSKSGWAKRKREIMTGDK